MRALVRTTTSVPDGSPDLQQGTGVIGRISRWTNPDFAGRWLLHLLQRAPDVAELI